MKTVASFALGALVGAAIAALLTPMSGEELRGRIKAILQKRGIVAADDIDELVEMIAAQVEEKK